MPSLNGNQQFCEVGTFHIFGDLAVRSVLNYARLEGETYRPDEVFVADKAGWPADWEGRLILALCLHARATRRTPAWLEQIMERVPRHLNSRGYFGATLDSGVSDEQQMAGHSWYLRGLLEHHALHGDSQSMNHVAAVVDKLLLPAAGNYARYPLDPATRNQSPYWKLSKLQTKSKSHAETSDCGCAFIMLDGATAAYEALRTPALKPLIEEMVARYEQVDFRGINVQTHATLSGLRGILRMHRLTGENHYLDIVKRMWDMYTGVAWTEAYGNYNWFDTPRWTEPCGIIDSFLLATQLWHATGVERYLADAHHIYYNAMSHALRQTGAFGTDTCVGPSERILKPLTYEVTWCCTMRGAEGLTRASQYGVLTGDDSVTLPFFHDLRAPLRVAGATLTIRERTRYPYAGEVDIEIEQSTVNRDISLNMYLPPWAETPTLTVDSASVPFERVGGFATIRLRPAAGTRIALRFGLCLRCPPAHGPDSPQGSFSFRHGPMILGVSTTEELKVAADAAIERTGDGRYAIAGEPRLALEPLHDIRRMTGPAESRQVLFGGQ